MKTAVPATADRVQKAASEPARSSRRQQTSVSGGGLGGLADMMNSSRRVQPSAQLKDDIQNSGRVQSLIGLAAALNQGAPAQLRGVAANDGAGVEGKAAPAQLEENAAPQRNHTGLPDQLKSGVESLSGVSLDNVKVHYNSAQPAQLNALAYAQGSDIHVAPGQEKHLPHEAWHVVQQAQGRVRPTMQMKTGVPINDDAGLEHEADLMGAKALSLEGRTTAHETGGVSVAGGSQAPVQRLIGFEVEYQVPTFGASRQAVTVKEGAIAPKGTIKEFLFGGLAYGTKLGGSAKRGENSYRITSDHKSDVSTEPIRAKLAELDMLDPTDTTDPDASSNLEYVTSPVDELAKGSDKNLGTLIDSVASHATTTFGLATQEKVSKLTAPATGVATGTPVDDINAWLWDDDLEALKPTIAEFRTKILDRCYVQATVGILPSAVRSLFAKASTVGGLHDTDDKYSQIYAAVDTATKEVCAKAKTHKYIKDLQREKETQVLASVVGMIQLLAMYLVGEALSQTTAFPGGSIKNAVPFLVKIDPKQISDAGPYGLLFSEVPDNFVTKLAESLAEQKEFKVTYWRGLGYEARARGEKWVTNGSIENLVKLFLQGKKPDATQAQTGSTVDELDPMTEINDSSNEKGVPLEYRYLKARPSATGLKAELLKIVAEAREINLGRVSEEKKVAIEKQVKE